MKKVMAKNSILERYREQRPEASRWIPGFAGYLAILSPVPWRTGFDAVQCQVDCPAGLAILSASNSNGLICMKAWRFKKHGKPYGSHWVTLQSDCGKKKYLKIEPLAIELFGLEKWQENNQAMKNKASKDLLGELFYYLQKQRERAEELALVDHPAGLLPWELRFLQEYAISGQLVDAMKQVCSVHELNNDHSLRMQAVALLKKPLAKKYLQHLQDRLEDMGVASMLEVQMFLTSAIRTPIGMIDDQSPLCQKKIVSTREAKDGTITTTTTLESVSKLESAKTLIKMKGWDAPIKLDVNHHGGVMVVPMAASMSDWEKAAQESQEKLMADAIDI